MDGPQFDMWDGGGGLGREAGAAALRLGAAALRLGEAAASATPLPRAMLVLTGALSVRLMTSCAERYLRRLRTFDVSQDRLGIRDVKLRCQLVPLIQRAASDVPMLEFASRPAPIVWRDPTSGTCHSVLVGSLLAPAVNGAEAVGRLAALFFPDASRAGISDPVECFATEHGLSPTETRLVRCLVSGMELKAAAARMGQQLSTTRTVLKSIFSKTDTHRQSELVARILNAR